MREFENAARYGVWTRNRIREPRWGFWPHPMGSRYPFFAPYKQMVARACRSFGIDIRLKALPCSSHIISIEKSTMRLGKLFSELIIVRLGSRDMKAI